MAQVGAFGVRLLLTSGRKRTGKLLNSLHCAGQQKLIWHKMSIVTRLRNSDLETRERRKEIEARALEHPTTGIQKRLKGVAVTEKDGGACRCPRSQMTKGFKEEGAPVSDAT